MTPQELKNSIMQLAIQGKLVEQRPEEGTGEELYHQIQIKKQELNKTGKTKKDKSLLKITEDEILFDIPESWKWVKFGDIVNYNMGKTPPRAEEQWWGNEYPWVSIADMPESGHIKSTKEAVSTAAIKEKFGEKISPAGTLIMSFKLTVGRVSILDVDAVHNEAIISIFPIVDNENTLQSYLFEILPLISQNGDSKDAIKGRTLNSTSINNLLIPLPPLAEQKRIVAKIEELLPLIDRYEEAWTKLEEFNQRFPIDLQKSLLQMAIQGKLVEQRPEEGTGEEVYTLIQAEKQALIKAGKIKKDKPLPEITDDEKPFDIPDSWKWVRLADVCSLISDGTHKTPHYVEKGVPFISVKDISSGILDLSNTKFITEEEHNQLIQRCKPEQNDILICRIGTLGKALKINSQVEFSIFVSLGLIKLVSSAIADYVTLSINSGYGFSWIQKVKVGGGTHTYKINLDDLRQYPFPLPPLAEQKRIVAKLDELMPLCERLK